MNTTYTNSSTVNLTGSQLDYISEVLLVCAEIVNFFLGLPLNVYVIFLLTRAGRPDESVIFILSQCANEILFALSAPLFLLCLSVINICSFKLLGFFTGLFMSAQPLFQCSVCLERYLAVVHPLTFLKFKPLRYRLAFLTVIWACVLPFTFTVMLTFPHVPYNLFGSLFLLVLVVELFCCVSVLKALRQPGPGERGMSKEESMRKNVKRKAFEIVFISLVTFLMQSTPAGVVMSLHNTMSESVFNVAISIGVTSNVCAGFIQVLFYLHKASKVTFPKCV